MIDSNKLLPSRGVTITLSKGSVKKLAVTERKLILIDNLLKEKLILSKVREGIRRQEEERIRMRQQEINLEDDEKDDDDPDGEKSKRKKPKDPKDGGGFSFLNLLSIMGLTAIPLSLLKNTRVFNIAANITAGVLIGTVFIGSAIFKSMNAIDSLKKSLKSFGPAGVLASKTVNLFLHTLKNFVTISILAGVANSIPGVTLFKKNLIKKIQNPKLKSKSVGANTIKKFTKVKEAVKEVAIPKINQFKKFFDFETAADFAKRTGRPFPNVAVAGEKVVRQRNITKVFNKNIRNPVTNFISTSTETFNNLFKNFQPKPKQLKLLRQRFGRFIPAIKTPITESIPIGSLKAGGGRSFVQNVEKFPGMRIGDLADDIPALFNRLFKRKRIKPKDAIRILKETPLSDLLRKGLRRFPIIGTLLDFGLGVLLGDSLGMAAFTTATSTLFGFIGGAIGSLFPGPGTIIGGLVGGVIGDQIGRSLYSRIFSKSSDLKVKPPLASTPAVTRGLDIQDVEDIARRERNLQQLLFEPDLEADLRVRQMEIDFDNLIDESNEILKGGRSIRKKFVKTLQNAGENINFNRVRKFLGFSGGGTIPDIASFASYENPRGRVAVKTVLLPLNSESDEASEATVLTAGRSKGRSNFETLYKGGLV